MNKLLLFVIVNIFLAVNSNAQTYMLEVNIKNAGDSMLLLAMHNGDKQYIRDSAYMDNKGTAFFTGARPLDAGVYIVAMGGVQLFDFIISDKENQKFTITTTKGDYTNTLHFKNSPENEEFANFNRYMIKQQKDEEELRQMVLKNPNDDKVIAQAEAKEKEIKEKYHAYVGEIAKKYPKSLLSSLVKTMDRPVMPKLDIDKSDSKYDSIYTMQYYLYTKKHYFDNYDFTDDRLVNTPVFTPSLHYYFDNILVQSPDTIIEMVDKIIERTLPNPTMTQFVVSTLFNKYLDKDQMGMESIVIHIFDKYYVTNVVKSNDSTWFKQANRYADCNRATLLNKKAADLKMQSLNGQYESIYGIDAPYMVVYFYEPNCGFCKTETPKIYNVYKKYRDKGFQVFAVYTMRNKEEWTKYVATNGFDWINVWDPNNESYFRSKSKYAVCSTPLVILLDKDKKIIGRAISAEGLDHILGNVFKNK